MLSLLFELERSIPGAELVSKWRSLHLVVPYSPSGCFFQPIYRPSRWATPANKPPDRMSQLALLVNIFSLSSQGVGWINYTISLAYQCKHPLSYAILLLLKARLSTTSYDVKGLRGTRMKNEGNLVGTLFVGFGDGLDDGLVMENVSSLARLKLV